MKLSDYVRQVMRDKNLTLKAVERNSHGRITQGYVNDLVQEKTKNPSVEKLKALALGLRVSEEEIFRVARGLSIEIESNQPEKMIAILNDLSEGERSSVMEISSVLSGLSEDERSMIVEMLSIFSHLPEGERFLTIEFANMLLNRHRTAEAARAVGKPAPPPEPIPFLEAIAIDADEEDESVTHAVLIEDKETLPKKRKPAAKTQKKRK